MTEFLDATSPAASRAYGARELNIGDLFCGAGGSSNGLARACAELGVDYKLTAVNHWDIAIASHTLNHPDAIHLCAEVDKLGARALSASGRLDILWASPSCTEHSYAKGGHSVDDQNRTSAWAVVREIERYRPRVIFVENVAPFRNWGPVEPVFAADGVTPVLDKQGEQMMRPIKARKGETFRAWFAAIESMGYTGKWDLLNSADYGTPQTRIRWFAIFTAPGVEVQFPRPTHGKIGTLEVQTGQRKPWVGARQIIDWSQKGTSIFERDRPLSPNTMRRIEEGIRRYCSGPLAEAFLVVLRNHADTQGLDKPCPTVTSSGTHIGLAETDLQPFVGANRTHNMPVGVDEPAPSVTTATGGGLYVAEPFILGQHGGSVARAVDLPVPTVTTDGVTRLCEPFIVPQQGADIADVGDPLHTVTTTSRGIRFVEPFIIPQGSNGAPRSVDEPAPTIVANGHGNAVVQPFLTSYYGQTASGDHRPLSVDEPVQTVTTANRFGLVEPFIVSHGGLKPGQDGVNRARPVDAPIATVTGSGGGYLVEPTADSEVNPFLTAHFGEGPKQKPRTHNIAAPLPTVTHRGAGDLVEPVVVPAPPDAPRGRVVEIDGVRYVLDVRFRMLQPHELGGAQDFPLSYKFAGTKTDQTAQIGNAVPGNVAKAMYVEALRAFGYGKSEAAA